MGFFTDLNSGKGIPFMDDRDAGDKSALLSGVWHFEDYGYIDSKNGNCAVVIFAEDAEHFFFMNSVVTEMLRKVDAAGKKSEIPRAGVKFYTTANRDGSREYFTYEFVSEDDAPF